MRTLLLLLLPLVITQVVILYRRAKDRSERRESLKDLFHLMKVEPSKEDIERCLDGEIKPFALIALCRLNTKVICKYFNDDCRLWCAIHPDYYSAGLCEQGKCPDFER